MFSETLPHTCFTRALLLTIFVFAVLTGHSVSAQSSYGSVVGTVADTSGAEIAGAQVSLKNNGTNATQSATTGSGGTYSFQNLNPGSYAVTVTYSGFKTYTQNPVDVTIGGTTRVNAALTVGNVSETVSVEASSTTELQTDSSALGGVVEG